MKLLRKKVNNTLLDLTTEIYNGGSEIQNWKEFLKNGIFTYKYLFSEQLQIREQAKKSGIKARAAASLDVWDKFGYKLKSTEVKSYAILDSDNSTTAAKPKQGTLYDIFFGACLTYIKRYDCRYNYMASPPYTDRHGFLNRFVASYPFKCSSVQINFSVLYCFRF